MSAMPPEVDRFAANVKALAKERRISHSKSGSLSLSVDELLLELGLQVRVIRFSDVEGLARSLHMEFSKEARARIYQGKLKGTQVLVKRLLPYPLSMSQDEDIVAEAQGLYDLHHGCLIRLVAVVIDNKERAMVYEFVAGTLANVLKKHHKGRERAEGMSARFSFSKEQRMYAILQVASAVTFLHEQQPPILHGAVCAFNVGMVGKRCRLGDFIPQGIDGQPWEPPEASEPGFRMTEVVDTYGFGMLLLELVTGQPLEMEDGTMLKDTVLKIFRDAKEEDPEPKLDALCLPDIQWPIGMVKVLLNVALWCTAGVPSKRPSMRACLTKMCELASVIIPEAVKSLPESIWESQGGMPPLQIPQLYSPSSSMGSSTPGSNQVSPTSPRGMLSPNFKLALTPLRVDNEADAGNRGEGMHVSLSAPCLSPMNGSISPKVLPSPLVRWPTAGAEELAALEGGEGDHEGSVSSGSSSGRSWLGKAKQKIKNRLERRKSTGMPMRDECDALVAEGAIPAVQGEVPEDANNS